jgi:predicted component of type VI protein secretion system
MYRITFLNGPARGRRLTVRTGSVRIGRGPDCAVRLSDSAMALCHAEVEERDGHPYLRNLDPLHGLEVDGRKPDEGWIRLSGRERIRIGATELKIEPAGIARRLSTRRWTPGQVATAAAILALLSLQGLAILSLSSLHRSPETIAEEQEIVDLDPTSPEPAEETVVAAPASDPEIDGVADEPAPEEEAESEPSEPGTMDDAEPFAIEDAVIVDETVEADADEAEDDGDAGEGIE